MLMDVRRLLRMLASESLMLETLFVRRDGIVTLSQLQELSREGSVERLVENGLLVSDGTTVGLDEDVRTFFEAVLDSSDEIEIGNIAELIDEISSKIALYDNVDSRGLRQRYISRIERILKKIPMMVSKSLVKLHQHIHLTYKSADTYDVKRMELDYYKEKLGLLVTIDRRLETTLTQEAGFFKNSAPQSTSARYYELKAHMTQMRISLVDLQRQVVDYINKISPDVGFFRHITRLKALKNSYEIKERTNIVDQVRQVPAALALLPRIAFSTQLEKEYAHSVDFADFVERWSQQRDKVLPTKRSAAEIDAAYLDEKGIEEYVVDTEGLHRAFLASEHDLFTFIMEQDLGVGQDLDDRLSTYCDMAGIYAKEYLLTEETGEYGDYHYLMIYPKEG